MIGLWDISSDLERLWDEMDRAFGRVFASAAREDGRVVMRPTARLSEDGDGYVVEIDLPGVTKDACEVEVDGRTLRVRAVRDEHRAYERVFSLPDTLDPDRFEAHLADGVLTLRLPKREQLRPRRVPIGIGRGEQEAIEGSAEPEVEGSAEPEKELAGAAA